MKDIIVKRSSFIYKLFDFLSTVPPFSIYIRRNHGYSGPINSFNDVCTFCRHVFYSLFISFPILAMILIGFSIAIFSMFIYVPYLGLIGESTIGMYICYAYVISALLYLGLCTYNWNLESEFFVWKWKRKLVDPEVVKEPGTISKILEIMAQKNDKFCSRIKVED